MSESFAKKLDQLHLYLNSYQRVAIAFSGGVDSTVLLHICRAHFGSENTFAFFCDSCLQSRRARENAQLVIVTHFSDLLFESIEVFPLENELIASNDKMRCYHCKKHTFKAIWDRVDSNSSPVVFDGTNLDDLGEDRPGLRAARELGVRSPLADAGITKEEIRSYARSNGLVNSALPSNSCLATRIPNGQVLTTERLTKVENGEDFLYSLGLTGCRVRVNGDCTLIELQEKDIEASVREPIREEIVNYFRSNGYPSVFIRLLGR